MNLLPETKTVLLRDCAPTDLTNGCEFYDTRAAKLADVEVVAEFGIGNDEVWLPWPGKEKNVMNWWLLANGLAVGWNENPSRGWSFPVIRPKAPVLPPAELAAMQAKLNVDRAVRVKYRLEEAVERKAYVAAKAAKEAK